MPEKLAFAENLKQLKAMRIGFPQTSAEFESLAQHVCELKPRVFVEIGTREGGSLWMLSRYLPDGAIMMSLSSCTWFELRWLASSTE